MAGKLKNLIGISCNYYGYGAVDVICEGKLICRSVCFGQAIDTYRELAPLGYDVLLYPANSWIRDRNK